MIRSLVSIPAALGTLFSGALAQDTRLDFPAFAETYLEEHDLRADGLTFEALLDGPHFVRLELGAYDVRIPLDGLSDTEQAEFVRDACRNLVQIQGVWEAWRHPESDVSADVKELDKWIKSWAPRKMGKLDGGAASLYEQLGAKDKVLAARDRLAALTAVSPEVAQRVGALCVTILAPSRKHFLQLGAIGGYLNPEHKRTLWTDALIRQSAAWYGWVQLIALENSAWPVDYDHPYRGLSLNDTEKTGLAQHVADRGAVILLRKAFLDQGTHFFEEALASNVVIASVGKKGIFSEDWEISYYQAGGKTEAYSRFVPGGNPAGGTLPARKATRGPMQVSRSGGAETSRYTEGFGEGFFLEAVRDGQKAGAKLIKKNKAHPLRKDPLPHFELYSLETHESTTITAPFLGRLAEDKQLPPDAFLDDYEDFFRAYRSCFLEWLRTKGAGNEKDSERLFAALIVKQAARTPGVALDDVVEGVYGLQLSASDGDTDSIEWRYLAWLAKGH